MSQQLSDHAPPESGALRQAALLDADGRHEEAVNALARAARFGDADAMTELGKRLITGERAPALPRQGAGLLIDATNRGAAEAPALLAILAATGIECEQSWPQAMELLAVAAARGSAGAQSQLRALAPAEAAGVESSDGDQWRRIAASVDLKAWLTAPPEQVLHADPQIHAYPEFVAGPVCDWVIERSRNRLGPALVYDPVAGANIKDKHRSNTAASFTLMETDIVLLLIQHRMWACCGIPLRNMETLAVLHYAPGEEITNHFDFVDPKTPNYDEVIAAQGQRIVTFLLYLNEEYEGGETEFPRLGVKHKGRRGEGLYFVNALKTRAPDVRMIHAGRPPAGGEKWVVSQFIRDRAVLRGGAVDPGRSERAR